MYNCIYKAKNFTSYMFVLARALAISIFYFSTFPGGLDATFHVPLTCPPPRRTHHRLALLPSHRPSPPIILLWPPPGWFRLPLLLKLLNLDLLVNGDVVSTLMFCVSMTAAALLCAVRRAPRGRGGSCSSDVVWCGGDGVDCRGTARRGL